MKLRTIFIALACLVFEAAESSLVLTMQSSSSSKSPSLPLSESRRALINKAKSIDPALAKSEETLSDSSLGMGSYSSVGWSNRLGTVLTPASIPGVYTADRPFIWNDIDVGGKMTVVQLQSSLKKNEKPDLFIHSPVFLDEPLIDALDKLGTVKHVVSPNYEHVKYAKQWSEYYEDAYVWGCPGIMEKEPQVRWTSEIPFGCRPPGYDFEEKTTIALDGMWDWTELQPIHIDCERLPILRTPFFSEVLFYHAPSKSLLVTDAYWNYPRLDGKTNADYVNKASSSEDSEERDFGVWTLAPDVGRIPFSSR